MNKTFIWIMTLVCLTLSFNFVCLDTSLPVGKGQAKKWQKDLIKLHEELKERHVNIYHQISKDSLDGEVERLYRDIPQLSVDQILVRIAQLIAKIGDGHTSFYAGNQRGKWFNFFPIKFWAFHDGTYVTSTINDYQQFLGRKLIAIENTPMAEVYSRMRTTVAADNDMEYTYTVPFDIPRPEFLYVLGITESDQRAEFHFENGSATLYPMREKEWQKADYTCANGIYPDGKSPSQRLDFLFASRLTIDSLKQRRYYWYKHLPESNAIYFQYNTCWDQKNRPSFATMTKAMFETLDRTKAERLIFDVRQNSGGEPLIAKPLMEGLKKRQTYLDEGRVFVLVGRRTYSAALTNAAQLRKIGARIVGEPSRGKPNNPSEGRDIILKRTRIWVSVSTQFVERDPDLGDQNLLPVDIPCPLTIEDYLNGKDLAFETAVAAKLLD